MGARKIRLLLVSYYCPTRAHAGGLRIIDIYQLIRSKFPEAQIDLLTHRRPAVDWSEDELNKIFNNIYYAENDQLSLNALISTVGGEVESYDTIDIQFHQPAAYIKDFRRISKNILFTPMESLGKNFIIEMREKIKSRQRVKFSFLARGIKGLLHELVLCRKADQVICVSNSDAKFIRSLGGGSHVQTIETGLSPIEFGDALSDKFSVLKPCDRKKRIIYVAYFGSQTNIDALLWYLKGPHSLLVNEVPDYKLLVVGRGDLTPFARFSGENVELIGEVPWIKPYIESSLVGIAPALGGSGFRGKVNQYAILGIPTVASSISHLGLAYKNNEDIFVSDSVEGFYNYCAKLLKDEKLNEQMGLRARGICLAEYTWNSKWKQIAKAYSLPLQES